MTEAIRRNLIVDELLFAVQCGKLTQRERFLTLWWLKAGGEWTLNKSGISTELKARVLAACPLLAKSSNTAGNTQPMEQ